MILCLAFFGRPGTFRLEDIALFVLHLCRTCVEKEVSEITFKIFQDGVVREFYFFVK
jgi:hypothetical protein